MANLWAGEGGRKSTPIADQARNRLRALQKRRDARKKKAREEQVRMENRGPKY